MAYIVFTTLANSISSYLQVKISCTSFQWKASRPQAVSKDGDECYGIVFPKYKKGGYIV